MPAQGSAAPNFHSGGNSIEFDRFLTATSTLRKGRGHLGEQPRVLPCCRAAMLPCCHQAPLDSQLSSNHSRRIGVHE
jgi:hypothetical protein